MKKKLKLWLFWLAMFIVVGSHLYMLSAGLPEDQMTSHAVLNIIAGILFGVVRYK